MDDRDIDYLTRMTEAELAVPRFSVWTHGKKGGLYLVVDYDMRKVGGDGPGDRDILVGYWQDDNKKFSRVLDDFLASFVMVEVGNHREAVRVMALRYAEVLRARTSTLDEFATYLLRRR
jgi:hypothetical protein